MSSRLDVLRDEWDAAARSGGHADPEQFLHKCIEAGVEVEPGQERVALADLTHEVGDSVRERTGHAPEVGLQPYQGRRDRRGPRTFPDPLPAPTEHMVGRYREFSLLNDKWAEGGRSGRGVTAKVVSVIAWGGAGKTSLVLEWLRGRLKDAGRAPRSIFYWSFDGQLGSGRSPDMFLQEAMAFFGVPTADDVAATDLTEEERRNLRVEEVAKRVAEGRNLLILDGLEEIQESPNTPDAGALTDSVVRNLLTALARDDGNRSLCLLTSRFPVADLEAVRGPRTFVLDLANLPPEDGAQLLAKLGVEKPLENLQEELRRTAAECDGHALTLTLLGTYLAGRSRDARDRGQIQLLGQEGSPAEVSAAARARYVMLSYEEWLGKDSPEVGLLCLLSFFDRPAESTLLDQLLAAPLESCCTGLRGLAMDSDPCKQAIKRLDRARLATVLRTSDQPGFLLDTHPLIREYFGRRLGKDFVAWREGNSRLFKALTMHRTTRCPTSLYEMMPWYATIMHACRAGKHQDAFRIYDELIRQGEKEVSTRRLAAYGSEVSALANFFARDVGGEVDWGRLDVTGLDMAQRYTLFRAAGIALRAQGRLDKAVRAWKQAFLIARKREKRERVAPERRKRLAEAAYLAAQMSPIWVTLGGLPKAERWASKAVKKAKSASDRRRLRECLCVLGDVWRLMGKFDAAHKSFQRAEALLGKEAGKDKRDKLYGVEGFWYCDLLLHRAEERAASQAGSPGPRAAIELERALEQLGAVRDRAEAIRDWAFEDGLALPKSLHSLTLGRALMLRELYAKQGDRFGRAEHLLTQAVAGLRNIRNQLPQALVALASLERTRGRFGDALADLAEAKAIAEAGAMKRYLPEIFLERARLYRDRLDHLPAESERRREALARARKDLERAGAAVADVEGFRMLDDAIQRLGRELDALAPAPAASSRQPPGDHTP